ncbi:MAG: hypothetical protein QW315_06055 [Candidatus Hadarchaeum sp.]
MVRVNAKMLSKNDRRALLVAQTNEITEAFVYKKLSESIKDTHNREILKRISNDEMKHAEIWKKHTGVNVRPSRLKMWKYLMISKLFGITFGLKLMERGEEKAQINYRRLTRSAPISKRIEMDEIKHEKMLLEMIDEDRLKYTTSMSYGLSDAIVELTGALAGFSLILHNTALIALAVFIIGISAALSMASSEYLATKLEKNGRIPAKAAIYTGLTYIFAVLFLIYPYLIFTNPMLALVLTIVNAVVMIFIFTFYVSVTANIPMKRRFLEMVIISFGVAALSFSIGLLTRQFLAL